MTIITFNFDLKLFIFMSILIFIGMLGLYSASYNNPQNSNIYLKQFLWFIIGIIAMIPILTTSLNQIEKYAYLIYFISIFLLIITLIFGKTIRGTKGWIGVGPINFQFSELAKITTTIALARCLEYNFNEIKRFKDFFVPFLILLLPVFLILLQPDLGATLIFFPILFSMLFFAGADSKTLLYFILTSALSVVIPMLLSYYQLTGTLNKENIFLIILSKYFILNLIILLSLIWFILKIVYFFYPQYQALNTIATFISIIILSIIFSVLLFKFLKDYQKKRILVFIDPKLDYYGVGYNIIQSKITIGSGGLWGKGFLKGMQTKLGFLPEPTTDFIVSVIGEEFGFIGMFILILIYFLFIFEGFKIAYRAKNVFASLLGFGISTMFTFSFFTNVGMVVGIMPVVGVTLPFLSYGGSSLVSSMIAVAILMNIKKERFI